MAKKSIPRESQSDTEFQHGGMEVNIQRHQNWGSTAYTAAVAGAAVVVGISMLALLKRSNT